MAQTPSDSNVVASYSQVAGMSPIANIPKLDGTNFQSWYELVGIVLELKGLSRAIKLDEGVETRVDLQARLIILESMNESHRAQVRGCSSAKQIVDRLLLIYADKSAANIYRLLHQYYRYTKRPEDSISEHIGRMDEMRGRLADLGEEQSEAVYQVTLIGSLPQEYATIMEIWELTHPQMRTTANLVSRLLKREEDLKKANDQALIVRGGKQKLTKQEVEDLKKRTKCGICKEVGHWARECPKNQRAESNNKSIEKANLADDYGEVEVMFNVTNIASNLYEKWVSDSGASSHMANNEKWFSKLEKPKSPRYVTVGDGKRLEIKGVGIIDIESFVDGIWIPSKMTGVLYVPGLSTNLFSIGAAADKGISTMFVGNECRMTFKGKLVASGVKLNEKLYLMRIRVRKNDSDLALAATAPKSITDYHKRLGHVGIDRIRQLLTQLQIKLPSDQEIDCEDCPGGKGKHASHPLKGQAASEPGHLHVDLSGVVNKASIKGCRYYMLCKDEFTDFVFLYTCKSKSEVPSLLAQLLIDFEALTNTPVRTIQTDNGSEFVNRVNELLFLKNNVKHLTSAPFCPQQNGRIEREMQTITNMARTLLNASKLPKELWPEALATAVYLKNRLPNSRSHLTPFERLLRKQPKIDHVVEFGCPAHVIVNDEYLTKWDSRTVEGFVVGYTSRTNTYKIYVPSKLRVIESCDIIIAKHATSGSKAQAEIPESSVEVSMDMTHKPKQVTTTSDAGDHARDHESNARTDETLISNSTIFETPEQTMVGQRESTPVNHQKSLCTGSKLDEFFRQYVNTEPKYAEIDSGEPIYQNEPSSIRPAVPPPPPPSSDRERSISEVTQPSYSTLTQHSQHENNDDWSHDEIGAVIAEADQDLVPRTYKDAISCEESDKWKEAIKSELDAHKRNGTWRAVQRPTDMRPLSTKWVFTIKRDAAGKLEKYKGRLVVRGFEQQAGRDYDQTFAPVARIDSVRTMLALCAVKDWCLTQFDISTAFLNGKIEERVYIEPPAGLSVDHGQCLKLDKALYGLKQAPRAWNSTFNAVLIDLGFTPTISDTCVYTDVTNQVYVLIYVDDGLIFARDKSRAEEVIQKLSDMFCLKRLGGTSFLGMAIERDDDKLSIHQHHYIQELLTRFGMADCKGLSSPIVETRHLMQCKDSGEPTDGPYQAAIGALNYLACRTRPDILFAVSFLSRFNSAPKQEHWSAVKRIFRYLKSTARYKLTYSPTGTRLIAYSDADFANDVLDQRRSTSGLVVCLGGGPIIYSSRKQSQVAQSSTEAEFVAANEVTRELRWLTQFLDQLGIDYLKPVIFIDNLSTIKQIETGETKRRSKHLDIKFNYIREQYRQQLFSVEHIGSEEQVADLLTKPISGPQVARLLKRLEWQPR